MRQQFPHLEQIFLLNDAEAHLYAHAHDVVHPCLNAALGTSIGIAVSDENGKVLRSRHDMPLEFGGLQPRTRSGMTELWELCGNVGLEALQNEMGTVPGIRHFGHRTGSLLAQLAGLFHLRTIVVSGGLVSHNAEYLWPGLVEEFMGNLSVWLKASPPSIILSPLGMEAGLAGAARYAYNLCSPNYQNNHPF